jgi:hypothetical protein
MEGFRTLEDEYAGDDIYCQKVHDLAGKYKSMRRTRPDGNCFFRAFSYAYLEQLLDNREEYDRCLCILIHVADSFPYIIQSELLKYHLKGM